MTPLSRATQGTQIPMPAITLKIQKMERFINFSLLSVDFRFSPTPLQLSKNINTPYFNIPYIDGSNDICPCSIKKRHDLRRKTKSIGNGKEQMERAQVWSIDVLLAVVIFLSIIMIFYVSLNSQSKPNIRDLQSEAGFLRTQLEVSQDFAFLTQDQINDTKFQQFADVVTNDYDDTKQKLGMRSDFCIYMEDEDGNLIILKNSAGDNLTGMGSQAINISDTPCGQAQN
jgi:hypothetical protein